LTCNLSLNKSSATLFLSLSHTHAQTYTHIHTDTHRYTHIKTHTQQFFSFIKMRLLLLTSKEKKDVSLKEMCSTQCATDCDSYNPVCKYGHVRLGKP